MKVTWVTDEATQERLTLLQLDRQLGIDSVELRAGWDQCVWGSGVCPGTT